jgi:hypothetical protein
MNSPNAMHRPLQNDTRKMPERQPKRKRLRQLFAIMDCGGVLMLPEPRVVTRATIAAIGTTLHN